METAIKNTFMTEVLSFGKAGTGPLGSAFIQRLTTSPYMDQRRRSNCGALDHPQRLREAWQESARGEEKRL